MNFVEARIVGNREENKLLFPFAIILIISLFSSVVTLLLRFAKIGNMRYHVSDHLAPPCFPGGVIAYISSSSSASSPASCHSEGSESSFQSASSSVPSSPNSTHSDSNGNPKNGDLSSIEGILKNDRIDCSMKTSKSSAPGVTKSHSGVTSEWSSFLTVDATNCRWGLLYHLFIWWGPFYFWVYFSPPSG